MKIFKIFILLSLILLITSCFSIRMEPCFSDWMYIMHLSDGYLYGSELEKTSCHLQVYMKEDGYANFYITIKNTADDPLMLSIEDVVLMTGKENDWTYQSKYYLKEFQDKEFDELSSVEILPGEYYSFAFSAFINVFSEYARMQLTIGEETHIFDFLI